MVVLASRPAALLRHRRAAAEEIDWRRDEIRLVQAKTSTRWYCRCRRWRATPSRSGSCTDGPGVTPRSVRPAQGAAGEAGELDGSTLMRRRLDRAGIDHAARDGKSFHACGARRDTAHRVGAGLPLAAAGPGHAASIPPPLLRPGQEQIRQCCLPLMSSLTRRAAMNTFTSNFAPT